jgi:hypothetical protein
MADVGGRNAGRGGGGNRGGGGRRGRGRPIGGGGARAGGRGAIQPRQVAVESDDEVEASSEDEQDDPIQMEPFPEAPEDDDDDEEDQPPAAARAPAAPESFQGLLGTALGDGQFRINGRNFVPGPRVDGTSIMRFLHFSPIQLVLYFAENFFKLLKDCSNEVPAARLEMKDMYCYHAALTLQTTVRMDKIEYYWKPPELVDFRKEAAKLRALFPLARYYHVRKHLRAYKMEDDVPDKGVGWKVVKATDEIHRVFSTTMSCPGQDISIDEGMAAACSTKNPIYTKINNKPLEGFRFILAVSFETKICVGLLPDLKQFPKITYKNHPGGFAGKLVCTLLDSMEWGGIWYRLWLDNYYNTLELTKHVLRTYSYCIGGTMQKGRKTDLINFGNAKHPKPTTANPKGALKIAKCIGHDIYEYAWMDSCGVYFIDSSHGPGNTQEIFRKDRQGNPIPYQVPAMIGEYNKFMGGVDVFDQVRKKNGNDVQHATKKYTVRMFEVLWSMCLSQAYNVYRYVNKNRKTRQKNPTQFKIDVIKGLLSHPEVVNAPGPVIDPEQHILEQTKPKSRGDGSNRKKVGKCRECSNTTEMGNRCVEATRRTTYYCSKCKVFFHPECFNSWHDRKGNNYVPSRQHNF